MKLRRPALRIWLIVGLGAAFGAGACGHRPAEPRIGWALPGNANGRDAGLLAVQAMAQQAALRGLDLVRVSFAASQSPYSAELATAEALTGNPAVVAAVGHQSSRATLLAAPLYNDAGIPLIVPTGTSRMLREAGPWLFPMAPDEQAEGEFIVRFVVERLGAREVTIFYVSADEYGLGLRDGILGALRRRGMSAADVTPVLADSNFAELVGASLDRGKPDAAIIAGRRAETFGVVRALHERVPGLRCIASDAFPLGARELRRLGASATDVYAPAFWHADLPAASSRAFAERFRTVLGREPEAAEAMAYDGVMLAATAVAEVGASRRSIRQYLESLGRSRPPYPGITGPISFAPDRRVNLVMTRGTLSDASLIVGDR